MRELATDALVRVFYPSGLYPDVAQAVEEQTTVLLVGGNILYDRATEHIAEMRADRIERVRMLSGAEFETLIGSAPDYEVDFDAYAEDAA